MNDQFSLELERLQKGLRGARQDYVNAKQQYSTALAVAKDLGFSSDGCVGLRRASRNYRQAIDGYAAAVQQLAQYLKRHRIPD